MPVPAVADAARMAVAVAIPYGPCDVAIEFGPESYGPLRLSGKQSCIARRRRAGAYQQDGNALHDHTLPRHGWSPVMPRPIQLCLGVIKIRLTARNGADAAGDQGHPLANRAPFGQKPR